MAFGSDQFAVTLDGYNIATNAVSAAVAINKVVQCSGIDEEAQFSEVTALGDDLMHEVPAGLSRFADITLRMEYESGSGGNYARIGPPARRADYPKRTLTLTYATGVSHSLEVRVARRTIPKQVGDTQFFEVTLKNAGSAQSEFVETGW